MQNGFKVAFVAAVAFGCAAPAHGQDVAQQVRQIRNGTLDIVFASKPGVCGDGESYISTSQMNDEGKQSHMTFTQTRKGWNTNISDERQDYRRDCKEGPIRVSLTVADGEVTDVEANVGGSLPSSAVTVSARSGVTYLLGLAEKSARADVGKHALMPAILADSVELVPELLRIARSNTATREVRKSAIFWMSHAEDEGPAPIAELRSLMNDDDAEIRKQVVFALSQVRTDEAATELIKVARNDGSSDVRKSAIFWLGQAAGQKATEGLKTMIQDGDSDVRKQAVFALSQLPGTQSVDALLEVVKTSRDREVRKAALFWLGQKNDPRVLALYEELLLKE